MISDNVRIYIPRRPHRKARINRKWAKRYGVIGFSAPYVLVDTPAKLQALIRFARLVIAQAVDEAVPTDWKTLDFPTTPPVTEAAP